MKVSVITRWFEEEFFAPFFLSHYAWADEIIVLLERTSNDRSAEIVSQFTNARVEWQDNGTDFNDRLMSNMMSDYAAASKSDWVIRADADELLFPYGMKDPRETLSKADGNVINAKYRWVFRHRTDKDLDPSLTPLTQRRHGGEYRIWPGMGPDYVKPSIVKPYVHIRWTAGEQSFSPNSKAVISKTMFDGAHWQTADVEMWIKRNAANDRRLSEENKKNGWGVKNFTEEMIRAECESHLDDPQVF